MSDRKWKQEGKGIWLCRSGRWTMEVRAVGNPAKPSAAIRILAPDGASRRRRLLEDATIAEGRATAEGLLADVLRAERIAEDKRRERRATNSGVSTRAAAMKAAAK